MRKRWLLSIVIMLFPFEMCIRDRAYMLTNVVSFRCIGESLFFGTQQYLGNYYPVLIAMCNVSVIYVLLYAFYKHNIFLKV